VKCEIHLAGQGKTNAIATITDFLLKQLGVETPAAKRADAP
jgi:hypothetical protein